MASNFKIMVHQNSESLHLKLMGDFDGSSAHELLNAIKGHGSGRNKIFIHTSGLKNIYPFGKAVFQNQLTTLHNLSTRFIFTGENVDKISPEENGIYSEAIFQRKGGYHGWRKRRTFNGRKPSGDKEIG